MTHAHTPDELLDAVLDYRQDMDPIAELELLAFDDEEVAGRLEIMGLPIDAATVDSVKSAAAAALSDDPGPY
jgi:hypothetical protein